MGKEDVRGSHLVVVQDGQRGLRRSEKKIVYAHVPDIVSRSRDDGTEDLHVGEDARKSLDSKELVGSLNDVGSVHIIVIEQVRVAAVVAFQLRNVSQQGPLGRGQKGVGEGGS